MFFLHRENGDFSFLMKDILFSFLLGLDVGNIHGYCDGDIISKTSMKKNYGNCSTIARGYIN